MSLKSLAQQAAATSAIGADASSTVFSSSIPTSAASQNSLLQQSQQGMQQQQPTNVLASSAGQAFILSLGSLNQSNSGASQEAKIPAALGKHFIKIYAKFFRFMFFISGASPLGKVQLAHEHAYQLSMLETGTRHLPFPADSERLR